MVRKTTRPDAKYYVSIKGKDDKFKCFIVGTNKQNLQSQIKMLPKDYAAFGEVIIA